MKKLFLLIPLAITVVLGSCNVAKITPTHSGSSSGVPTNTGRPTSSEPYTSSSTSTSIPTGPGVNFVRLNYRELTLNLTDYTSEQLIVNVSVRENVSQEVTFVSQNPSVATVSETGLIRAVSGGSTTIVVTSVYDPSKTATCNVRVSVPTILTIDSNSITSAGNDTYNFNLVSDNGQTIRAAVVGATKDGNDLLISDECYLYNIDPVDGIASCDVSLNANGSYYGASSFFSYNELTFSNILSGQYSDLISFVYPSGQSYYSNRFFINQQMCPQLANARYALLDLMSLNGTGSGVISSISIGNDGAILHPVDVGYNYGVFSDEEIEYINSITNNCFTPTSAGNGAYAIQQNSYRFNFYQLVSHDAQSNLISSILNSGFTKRGEAQGAIYYQKQVNDVVHSFATAVVPYKYCDLIQVSYMDSLGLIENTSSWPSAYLAQRFSSENISYVPAFTNPKYNKFLATSIGVDGESETAVLAYLGEGYTFDVSDIEDYCDLFDSSKFTYELNDNGYGPSAEIYTANGLFSISIIHQGDYLVFLFYEIETINILPTAEEIAKAINLSNHIDDIIVFDGGPDATYAVESGYSSYFYYRIYNSSETYKDAFISQLKAVGFSEYYGESNRFAKKIDYFGNKLIVEIEKNTKFNYYRIEYYISETSEWSVRSSFADALSELNNYYSDETVAKILNAVSESSSYKYYRRYDYNGFTVVVQGASTQLINQLTNIQGVTVNSEYGIYYYEEDNSFGVAISEIDEGVVLEFNQFTIPTFTDYTSFNNYVDDYIYYQESRFYLEVSDQLPSRFVNNGYSGISFYGSEIEVNSLKDLIISRIIANGHYTYSEYLGQYVDADHSRGVEISIYETHIGAKQYYCLSFRLEYQEYTDYHTFADADIPADVRNTFNLVFPTLPFNTYERNMVADYYYSEGTDKWTYEFRARNVTDDYVDTLLAADFRIWSYDNSYYYKIFDNKIYLAAVYDYYGDSSIRSFTFRCLGSFVNSETLYNSVYDKTALDYIGFTTNFTQSSPSYLLLYGYSDDTLFIVQSEIEINNFKNYLTTNDFVLNEYGEYVQDLTTNHSLIITVSVTSMDGLYLVSVHVEERNYVSWAALVAILEERGHRMDIISEYFTYPSSNTNDEYYYYNYAYSSYIDILISSEFDLDAYIELLVQEHPELTQQGSIESGRIYFRSETAGSLTIYIYDYYYEFYISFNSSLIND